MVLLRKHCRINALDGVASTGRAGGVNPAALIYEIITEPLFLPKAHLLQSVHTGSVVLCDLGECQSVKNSGEPSNSIDIVRVFSYSE
jgi:hypothetical protein